MYDIPELERKWRKYKRNQIKKPLLYGLGALILIGGIGIIATTYFSNVKENEILKHVQRANNTQQSSGAQKSAIIITKTPITSQQTNTTLQTTTQTRQNPLIGAQPTVQTPPQQQSTEGIDLSNAKIVEPKLPKDDIRVIGFDNQEKKKVKADFNGIVIPQKSAQEIQEQEKIAEREERFKSTQDPQDSLYIAKYYYKKGDYKKAETWAINTNNIDGDIEESWIIFAKARAKQGFRVDAIKVLQSYYDETKSPRAKELLDKLRFGKKIQ